ncbi:transporter substrate-binding domain-containing protein [Terrilactibacillus sp. BCM23-1]|uniref:Transporter substrate-binding domain-containing protein n=1 Tax=Terrilactibacillus tamarindi TaxID=2599694 RepID=A0A6N8CSY2_9BACI|nr:ABC transporter substrate-binding protein [Terrilactibacillus tamarindi]MTT32810.1 transporter substrate-binding domain-containing protein [Terrilactibacillus tamarindi]
MKKLTYLVVVMILLMVLTACGSKSSDKNGGGTLADIKDSGELTIAVDDTYPPMEFRDDKNKLVGLDIDLGRILAKKLGVKAKFVPTAWDGIIPGLDAKKYDIIMSSMNITDERKKQVNFVQYLNFGQAVIVKKGNPLKINSKEDLKGKVVGVQLGTTSETAAKAIGGIKQVKTYNGYTDAFNDMGLGRLDAIVVGEMVGRYYMKTKPNAFEIVGDTFQELPVGIAVRKSDKDLSKALEKAIKEMQDEGSFDKVKETWFGK